MLQTNDSRQSNQMKEWNLGESKLMSTNPNSCLDGWRIQVGSFLVLIACATAFGNDSLGQTQCPQGMLPKPGGCESPVGGNSSPPARKQWMESRYGAIAADESGKNGRIGTSSNVASRKEAESVALSKCKPDCTIWLSVENLCIAIAHGRGNTVQLFPESAQSLEGAESRAVAACMSQGVAGCEAKYSACSLPVRGP